MAGIHKNVFRFNVGVSGVPNQGNIGAFATVCADSSVASEV
jgi:hypothetical protein